MKLIYILIFLLILLLYKINIKTEQFKKNNNFLIVVTFYNPGYEYLKKCLESIKNQNYKKYRVCMLNDFSTNEVDELEELCTFYKEKYGWLYHKNKVNVGPCHSRINAINFFKPEDNDVILLVDGDDKLNNDNVLTKLNEKYQDDTLITFGNFMKVSGRRKYKKSISCSRINLNKLSYNKTFRNVRGFPFSHLKTFKYKLYKNLNHDDLKKDGEYIRSATDLAIMYPLLEMAGTKIKCINDVLYNYTYDHVESLHNDFEKKKKQTENANFIRNLKKYNTLPENEKKTFHIYYINLKKRTDRRKFIVNELKQLEHVKDYRFIAKRMPAIKNLKHGAIGCGKSHIKILQKAKKLNLPFVFVMEDDIKIKFNLLKESLKLIENKQDYDVIILSGHGERNYFNSDFDKAVGIQTAGWYLVKNHYYDTLINTFQESVDQMEKLIDNGQDPNLPVWAIDMNWKKLQKKDNWFILKKNLGYQISNHSDIEKRVVDYTKSLN